MKTCKRCGLLGRDTGPCQWCPKIYATNKEQNMPTPQYERDVVEDSALQKIDWHRHEYPLGVRTSLTEAVPGYNALTEEELEVLHKVLTVVLPGADTSIARQYLGLSELACWARECAAWAKRHP